MIGDRILVVCTANMIRSPFVAGLLSTRLAGTGLVVDSAGTSARPGASADERVVALGASYGLDLAEHRSHRLDDGMLRTGDTVLCAERVHCRVVLDLRPDLISSVFTIREFSRAAEASRGSVDTWPALVRASARSRLVARREPGDDDIVDPVGGPDPVWLDFERQATRAVSAILAALSALPAMSPERTPGRVPATRREYRGTRPPVPIDRRSGRRS